MPGIVDLILGILNHQTEAEKKDLFSANNEADYKHRLQYDPQIQSAMIGSKASTLAGLPHPDDIDSDVSSAIYNPDGSMNPNALSNVYQMMANRGHGLYGSNATTQAAVNQATQAESGHVKQEADVATSPEIADYESQMHRNMAETGAIQSGYPLEDKNLDLAQQLYEKEQLGKLAGTNRGILDNSMAFQPGSLYGFVMNPYTGQADIKRNPMPSLQTSLMTGSQPQTTGQPVYVNGQLVGQTPPAFDPESRTTLPPTTPPSVPITPQTSVPMGRPLVGQPTTASGLLPDAYEGAKALPSLAGAAFDSMANPTADAIHNTAARLFGGTIQHTSDSAPTILDVAHFKQSRGMPLSQLEENQLRAYLQSHFSQEELKAKVPTWAQ